MTPDTLIRALDDLLACARGAGQLQQTAIADKISWSESMEAAADLTEQEATLQSLRAAFEQALRQLVER